MVLISTKKNAGRMLILQLLLASLAQWPVLGEGSNEVVSPSPTEDNTKAEELSISPTSAHFSDGGAEISLRSTTFHSTMVTDQEIPSSGPVIQETASKPPAKPQIVSDSFTTIKNIEESTPTQSSLSTIQEMSSPVLTSSLSLHEPSTFAKSEVLTASLPSATKLMLRVITIDSALTSMVDKTTDSSKYSSSSSVLLSSPIQAKTNGSDLPVVDKDAPGDVTSAASLSPSTHQPPLTFTTMAYTTNQDSHGPTQVSEAETHSSTIMTTQPHTTRNDSKAAFTLMSVPSPGGMKTYKTYIVVAVVALALLLLAVCLVWNVNRSRNRGSISFLTTNQKKKKGGEDAWAGPVHMPDDNAVMMDMAVDESDQSGKRLTLTTFFNKRKSRQSSVVMENVNLQSEKPAKEEAAPLLSQSTNGQINGDTSQPLVSVAIPTSVQEPTPAACNQEATVQLQANGQVATVQETLPAPSVDPDALPPPSPPPLQTDFPAPPPASDLEGAGSMV